MNRLADFLQVRQARVPQDFYRTEHHIIGNHMRLNSGDGIVKRDDSWVDRLTQRDLAIIKRHAGLANNYFGHDWP
jgi:hypothetical protein